MLKVPYSVKLLEARAAEALTALLLRLPTVELEDVSCESIHPDTGIDFIAKFRWHGKLYTLPCEVKSRIQPHSAEMAALKLRAYADKAPSNVMPMIIAPYLSPAAQQRCREHDVGFLDFEGNAYLSMGGIYIERSVDSKPPVERRQLKTLFKPRSTQVLRVMLRDPARSWRVVDLSTTAGVSLGHVSNVRSALLEREWAQVSDTGFFLSEPDLLLDHWREIYEAPDGKRMDFYTTLHGSAFEEAARRTLQADPVTGRAMLASFSAAHWLAPYTRTGTHYFYADEKGLELLRGSLKLANASKGQNVSVVVLADPGLFLDAVEPAPSVFCTSPVQTWLDLGNSGERGREAADHLRRAKLQWSR